MNNRHGKIKHENIINNKVAIITRTKNREILLKRAVDSIVNQTYKEWCLVIVNDGGDNRKVKDIVSSYCPVIRDKIKIINNPISLGMEKSSNIGILNSDSKYLVIHDDDDSWESNFLEECVKYLDNSEDILAGVVTLTNLIEECIENDNITENKRTIFKNIETITIQSLLVENLFPPISFMYKRQILKTTGLYDEKMPILGDWDFNIRVIQFYRIGIINKFLANYHSRREDKDYSYVNSIYANRDLFIQIRSNYIDKYIKDLVQNNEKSLGELMFIIHIYKLIHKEIHMLSKRLSLIENMLKK